ncbi:hypothetical protein KCP69_16085 [Salmonella enterica subsp. enterica]|nr:hypothetical protein KCP69_16085 [Salmonella enterica subsp. enterica]
MDGYYCCYFYRFVIGWAFDCRHDRRGIHFWWASALHFTFHNIFVQTSLMQRFVGAAGANIAGFASITVSSRGLFYGGCALSKVCGRFSACPGRVFFAWILPLQPACH